jgi:hypothetical protein
LFSLPAFATIYPAETVFSGGLAWLKPDTTLRDRIQSDTFCNTNTTAGLTGWRLPTDLELYDIYSDKGSAYFTAAGWTNDWIYTSVPYVNWYRVVRLSDGLGSYTVAPEHTTCVHSAEPPSGKIIITADLVFQTPDAILRSWIAADAYCTASNFNGVGGWRLPTELELSNRYYDYGSEALTLQGWPSSWIWTSTPYLTGHQVARMSDGTPSYGTGGSYAVTCVRKSNTLAVGTITSGGLTWIKPLTVARPWINTETVCADAIIAGQTGWRLPTANELSALIADKGSIALADAGWPSDWIWTSIPYSSGHLVVRPSDALVSWGNSADSIRNFATCVR